jgi:hypothetical protein
MHGAEQNRRKSRVLKAKTLAVGILSVFCGITFDVRGEESGEAAADSRIAKLKAEIGVRKAELERERDRNGKLRSELNQKSSRGCHMNEPIKKVEILVQGDVDFNREKIDSGSDEKQNEGNPESFTIEIGENFSATIKNSESGLFSSQGKYLMTDVGDRKIRDIERISIVRNGVKYDNKKVCWRELFRTKCKYEHYEVEKYKLFGVSIVVNDRVLFQKKGFDTTFDRQTRRWNVDSGEFKANEAYFKASTAEDCVQKQ